MSTNYLQLILVGSTNPVKIAAARRVISQRWPAARLSGVAVPSGVSVQPWGDAETRRGALLRAQAALAREPEADLSIGLEGGLLASELGVLTCAWCVALDRAGRMGVGGGVNCLLPESVARQVQAGAELGPAMDALSGIESSKRKMGAVGILTDGLLDREAAYAQIVALALAPWLSGYYAG